MPTRPFIRVNISEQRLWRDGRPVRVKSKVFALLVHFLQNPGRLQTKAAILRHVWPETHVSEASIKDCVKNLREVLRDNAASPVFIETVRGQGYRYLGGIEVCDDLMEPEAVSKRSSEKAASAMVMPAGARPGQRLARMVAVLSLIVLVAGFFAWTRWQALDFEPAKAANMAQGLPAQPSIAVLPFANLSNEEHAEIFARGLTDDLTTTLGKLPQLFVSARSASDRQGSELHITGEIAESLGVRYLLEGSIQSDGKRLRVSAKLADALSGKYVWAEKYERAAGELFSIQDEIVLKILSELRVELQPGERLRNTGDTKNLASWLASTSAYGEFLKFRPANNLRARQLWKEALEHDPDRAVPHAGLAFSHYHDAYRGWSEDKAASIHAGVEAANEAIRRDPELPLGYQALGALAVLQGDFEKGLELRRKAAELGPNDFAAIGGLAIFLSGTRDTAEAVSLFRRAIRLNPTPPVWVPIWFGHALHMNGQAEEAASWLERAIERDASYAYVHARLAAVYADLGRMDDAVSESEKALELDPEFGIDRMRKVFMFRDRRNEDRLAGLLASAGFPD